MDDEAALDIWGYVECRCGSLLPHTELRPAPPMCPECRADLSAKIDQARLAYEVQGRTFHTPAPKKPAKPRKKKPALTEKQKEDRRKLDRARMRAYVRLARVYRPMYELLLDQEKAAEGLRPVTRSITPRPRAIAQALIDDLAEADERERHGASG